MSFDDKAAKNYRPCAELCPVGANPVCGELCESTQEDVEKFEAAVMKWAAEHPEPIYTSWGEWIGKVTGQTLDGDLLRSPIPADIAQKLGIEPKEG